MAQLRQTYGNLGGHGKRFKRGQQPPKKPGNENSFEGIRLPKEYLFILLPENGTEESSSDEDNDENKKMVLALPRRNSSQFLRLQQKRMVDIIKFSQGDFHYCHSTIINKFSHLGLRSFRFYQPVDGRSLMPAEICKSSNFTIVHLAQYLSI